MAFPSDNWTLPVDGTEEGLAYTQVAPDVRLYDVRGRYSDGFGDGAVEKVGYAVHHDAVRLVLEPTIDAELERIAAIHRYHTTPAPAGNGWGGIGYHRLIAPTGRVYLVGSSASQRAHVRGLNHLWIGVCFMGDFTESRPTLAAMNAFRVMLQWETDQRGVPMLVRAHKGLNPGTVCPGDWAAPDAWATLTMQPGTSPAPPIVPVEPATRRRALDHLEQAAALVRTLRD